MTKSSAPRRSPRVWHPLHGRNAKFAVSAVWLSVKLQNAAKFGREFADEIWWMVTIILLQNFPLKKFGSSTGYLRGIPWCWRCLVHNIRYIRYIRYLRIPTNLSHCRMPHVLPLVALVSISSSQSTPVAPEPPIDEAVPCPFFRLPVTLFVVRTILGISNEWMLRML